MDIEIIVVLALIVAPSFIFYSSMELALNVIPNQGLSKPRLLVRAAIGGSLVLLIWGVLPDPTGLASFVHRITNAPNLIEGVIKWQTLLHYQMVLVVTYSVGHIYGKSIGWMMKTRLGRQTLTKLGPIYSQFGSELESNAPILNQADESPEQEGDAGH